MRKFSAVLVIAFLATIALSGSASAQRDPFDPVIDPNAGTVTTGDGTTTTDGTVTGDTSVPGSIVSEDIANTGTDVTPFVVVAFVLLSLGGLALAWVRLNGSPPHGPPLGRI